MLSGSLLSRTVLPAGVLRDPLLFNGTGNRNLRSPPKALSANCQSRTVLLSRAMLSVSVLPPADLLSRHLPPADHSCSRMLSLPLLSRDGTAVLAHLHPRATAVRSRVQSLPRRAAVRPLQPSPDDGLLQTTQVL
jgi:hypothetical protein